MGILSTPHAHTTYVDGKNTPREMALAALEKGFDSMGFSEHGRQTVDEKNGLSAENEEKYIAEIAALQREFAGRLPLWLGLERDFFSVADRARYDYVIGSVHYIDAPGGIVAVDGDSARIDACVREDYGGDGARMARLYFDKLAGYVADYRPDIIGHFDLVCKTNGDGRYFDEDGAPYRDTAFEALERMAPSDALLEINTGAIARGYKTVPYPRAAFLRRWRELGGRIIFSSDCHNRAYLDCAYDQARALALDCGYRTAWALGTGKEMFVEYLLI